MSPRLATSRKRGKTVKPYADFPLTPHPTGRWCKKIRGRLHYFGPLDDWQAALQKYLDEKDPIWAGRTPRSRQAPAATVADAANHFLNDRLALVQSAELRQRTWDDYKRVCDLVVAHFGKSRDLEALGPDDFTALRASLAKRLCLRKLGDYVTMIRMVFGQAFSDGLIQKPVMMGKRFSRPKPEAIRRARRDRGELLFTAAEIHRLLATATVAMRAMILLGVNCGLGNTDVGCLNGCHLDLDGRFLDFPRIKNQSDRQAVLWPETVSAVRAALAARPDPASDDLRGRVFLTPEGKSWWRDSKVSPVSRAFSQLVVRAKVDAQRGRGFYTLRRVFRTVADACKDQVAIALVMGHTDRTMAGVYRQHVDRERLEVVAATVHAWLFGDAGTKS